jgi:Uma2 family endonuclease
MSTKQSRTKPRRRPVTRRQFFKLLELGFFRGKRVELLNGVIYEMAAQQNFHAQSLMKSYAVLLGIFGKGYWVRPQLTLDLSPTSALDPDVSVVSGDMEDYKTQANPATALLVVEISDTTLAIDRHRKASIYARFGIQDYWIVNIKRRQLEVRRQPEPGLSTKHNYGYAAPLILRPPEVVSPLAAPQAKIAVADLLP